MLIFGKGEKNNMTRYEAIKEVLEDMHISDIVSVYNAYCDSCNYMDNYIYSMEEFDEFMSNIEPWKVARACYYGDFCPDHDYFYYNSCGNLNSFDFIESDTPISIDDIAEYIDNQENTLNNDELYKVINEFKESEEN